MLEGQKVLKGRLLGRVFKRLRYIMMITTNINYFFYNNNKTKEKEKERKVKEGFVLRGGYQEKREICSLLCHLFLWLG